MARVQPAARPAVKRGGPRYGIQVLDRVVQILGCFTSDTPELRLTDLQARLGLHKSSLFRILEAMRAHRLVEIEPGTGRYHLGLRLFELGSLAVGRLELARAATPSLEWLVEKTGETAHLCVLDGSDVVYIAKVESKHVLRMPSGIGRRNPAYCTGVGKAMLAFLPEPEIEDYLRRTKLAALTPHTIVDARRLLDDLRTARARGFALDDGEVHEGVRCVGAPIRDHLGHVVASISVAGPTLRVTKAKLVAYATHVRHAAAEISGQLGYVGGAR